MNDDFIFRYKLNPASSYREYAHRPAELIRSLLESVLNVAVPQEKGADLMPDSFRWLMDNANQYRIFPNQIASSTLPQDYNKETPLSYQSNIQAAFCEPRIDLIRKTIESLLDVIDFEHGGKKVAVDGFRLKNLADWTVAGSGNPQEVFECLGTRCNCDCVFCCNKGNQPSAPAAECLSSPTIEEIKTRVDYFNPDSGRSLFPATGSVYEVTIHPHFVETLRLLRSKTAKPFRITTNGCSLTTELITVLAEVKPVYLYLSLNSCLPSRRAKMMADKKPGTALDALPALKKAGIPFAAVIVPWPVNGIPETLEDMTDTIKQVSQYAPHIIQVNLPGYTDYFTKKELFNLEDLWSQAVARVRELREQVECPVVTIPAMYEENRYCERRNTAAVIGMTRNSPAYFSGIKRGDIISRIDGIPVASRPQARDLLAMVRQNQGVTNHIIQVNRDGKLLEIAVNTGKYDYPYHPEMDSNLGLVFLGSGFRTGCLEDLQRIIQSRRASRVLFLSSELVRPFFMQSLRESRLPALSRSDIDIEVPRNRYFGGNIFMGDLLVVQDFIDAIGDYISRTAKRPELVVIPSSPFHLSGWGRDLTGRVYLDIQRSTGIPVELLPCETIYA